MKRLSYGHIFFYLVLIFNMSASCQKGAANKADHSQMVPDSALFAKERPIPAIVRGFMMPELNDQIILNDVKSWGANVVRIQIYPVKHASRRGMDIWEALPSYMDQVEAEVKAAKQAGLKVVIDLHEPPFFNVLFKEAEFWNRPDLAENFCRIWSEISKRLLPFKETIWGYDLYNEPVDVSQYPKPPSQWHPVAVKIVEAIRKIDQGTWIIFEPGPWGSLLGFKGLQPLPDPHVIYSPHFYSPQSTFTHQGVNVTGITLDEAKKLINNTYPSVMDGVLWDKDMLKKELKYVDEFQSRWKVPIYVGEFSVVRWAPKDDAVRWLKDVTDLFETRGWSWSYHAFREFHGWSLEHDETFWMDGMPAPKPVTYETERAKVIKSVYLKNKN